MLDQKNPKIRKNFSVVVHNPDLVEIRTGIWNIFSHVIEDEGKEGKLFEIVKLLLTGNLSTQQIAKESSVSRSVVEGVIDQLAQLGAIETSPASAFDYYLEQTAMMLNRRQVELSKKLKRPILLLGSGVLTDEIERTLFANIEDPQQIQRLDPLSILSSDTEWVENGLEFEKKLTLFEPWKDYLWVCVNEIINPIITGQINRIAFALNINWLHVAIDGPLIFVGPLFRGGDGPCYNCFEKRITMNLREKDSYKNYKLALINQQVHFGKKAQFPALNSLVASFTVMEILNFSLTECAHTYKKALSIYLPTMEIVYNDLLQLSSCEVCSTVIHGEKQQLYFDIQTLLK